MVGPGDAESLSLDQAEEVGRELARRGGVVVCGGLGGVMEAACRGAKEGGGTTVGILPGFDRSEANPYVDVALATGLGEARNALVVRAADAVVAVGAGFGTLSEVALALKGGLAVVGLDTWELAASGEPVDVIARAGSPAEAAERAIAAAG